jgi:alpha-galactosidase
MGAEVYPQAPIPQTWMLTRAALILRFMISGSHASCRFEFTGDELLIGNRQIERRWKLRNGALFATSFKNLESNTEWITKPIDVAAPIVFKAEAEAPSDPKVEVKWSDQPLLPVHQQDGLVVELHVTDGAKATYRFQIFDRSPGVTMTVISSRGPSTTPTTEPAVKQFVPTGIEKTPTTTSATTTKATEGWPDDLLEAFHIAPPHARLVATRLVDQTDMHDNLLFEEEWLLHPAETRIELIGNVFAIENILTGEGLVFVKHAPLPHARPIQCAADCVTRGATTTFRGHGIAPDGGEGYSFALLSYTGGAEGRMLALHRHQRQFHPYVRERDGQLLTNTWGDRSQDTRVNESFMLKEIAAAQKLGADVVQIDDGWQSGRTGNWARAGGRWESFWKDPNFWKPNPERFPHGLEPIIKAAREANLKLGLWYAPDSADDFANWNRDAEQLLTFHRTLGINFFKLDGVKIRSKTGEINFHKCIDRVLKESGGAIVVDLDVTAQTRPGYFGMLQSGPVFVENRYTDWHRYWPHHTLRNAWMLSKVIDPQRLRMEFLNNERNKKLYENDPLAPAEYSPDYLFASVMLTSPLGWFEVSHLPSQYIDHVAKLAAIWKQHRDAIYSGHTIPIGEAPTGASWTGFLAGDPDGPAYALIFREKNERNEATILTSFLRKSKYTVERLAGDGTIEVVDGVLHTRIEQPLRFCFARLVPSR